VIRPNTFYLGSLLLVNNVLFKKKDPKIEKRTVYRSECFQYIVNNIQQFNLFNAVRLLQNQLSTVKELKINIVPHESIAFPVSDIKNIHLQLLPKNPQIILETTYFGLYGVHAPLPFYLLQETLREDKSGEIFRALLNIFNHRFYQLLFNAWKRGKSALYLENVNNNGHYTRYLRALSGNLLTDFQTLAYTGLFNSQVHHAAGLKTILQHFIRMPVVVEQFIPMWVPLEAPENYVLGHNTVLGNSVLETAQKIVITFGPILESKAMIWISNNNENLLQRHQLYNLIRRYAGFNLQFDIYLKIKTKRHHKTFKLGWSAWLGKSGHFFCIRLQDYN